MVGCHCSKREVYHASNIQLEQYNSEVAAEDVLQYIV